MKKAIYSFLAVLLATATVSADEVITGFFDVGEFAVYEFSVAQDVNAPFYFDLNTEGSTNPDGSTADTELLLFSGLGGTATFLFSDDDGGNGLFSAMSFGAGIARRHR